MDPTHLVLSLGARLYGVPTYLAVYADSDGIVCELYDIHGESLNHVARGSSYVAACEEMQAILTRTYHEGIRVIRDTKDARKVDEALRVLGLPGLR